MNKKEINQLHAKYIKSLKRSQGFIQAVNTKGAVKIMISRGEANEISSRIKDIFFENAKNSNFYGYKYWIDKMNTIQNAHHFWDYMFDNESAKNFLKGIKSEKQIQESIHAMINYLHVDKFKIRQWIESTIEHNIENNIKCDYQKVYETYSLQYVLYGNKEDKKMCELIDSNINDGEIKYDVFPILNVFYKDEKKTHEALERLISIGKYKDYILPNEEIKKQMVENGCLLNENDINKYSLNSPLVLLRENVFYDNIVFVLKYENNRDKQSYFDKFVLMQIGNFNKTKKTQKKYKI